MSKKVSNEKEIYKARVERRWDAVIEFAGGLNLKTAGGNLNTEELELYVCFLLGEALFEKCIDQYEGMLKPTHIFTKEELNAAFSYLNAAITAVKKVKESFPFVFQDAHMLVCKYHYIMRDYKLCIEGINSLDFLESDSLPKRTKYIKAEILTCKALSLEALNTDTISNLILTTYQAASKLVLSLCAEDEKNASVKRVTSWVGNSLIISNLLTNSFFRCANILVNSGKINEAIKICRQFLQGAENRATRSIRKTVCRCLAEILLSCTSNVVYVAPGIVIRTLPTSDSTLSLSKATKRPASVSDVFCPNDEVEESVLLLLLSEATFCESNVSQRQEDAENKKQLLNETSLLIDLLVLVLSRRDQYNHISKGLDRVMKLAFEEFHLWFQYGLAAVCDGRYKRALLIFDQCHTLQPTNTDVLLMSVKLCINYLQEYTAAINYANKVVNVTTDPIIEASARLAIGISQTHLACKENTSGRTKNILQDALSSLNSASDLCSDDVDIQFNLAFCQALTKQLQKAIVTIKTSLSVNHDHLPSLHLLALLFSAQKKYGEALEVIEKAIEEYPEDFNLITTKVKLSEECYGSQVALVACHYALLLWNDLHSDDSSEESEKPAMVDSVKSPSGGVSSKINESKFFDGTPSIKSSTKRSLHESSHLDTPMKKKSDSTSLRDEDCNGSLAASIHVERTLSLASESIHGSSKMTFSAAVSFLCRLWLITAECFINMGDLTEAIGCILEASSIFPLSPEVLYMRGRYNESKENIQEAKACYESALSVLPNHKAAAQRLGLLHHDEGNNVLAEKLLRGCVLQNYGNHTAWNDLGLVLESVGRCEEAGDCFMTSLMFESTAPIIPYTTIPRLFNATDFC